MLVRSALAAFFLATAGSAMAAVPQISCVGVDGFKAVLTIQHGTGLGKLTYGYGEVKKTIEGLDTSFVHDTGAATKGNEVLLVVTPVGPNKIGQLILEGKTRILRCI